MWQYLLSDGLLCHYKNLKNLLTYINTDVILQIEQRKPGIPVENDSGNDVSPGVSRGIIISDESFYFIRKILQESSQNNER